MCQQQRLTNHIKLFLDKLEFFDQKHEFLVDKKTIFLYFLPERN